MNRRLQKIQVSGKVNLSLNILGFEQGFHRLDTVMASVSLADSVTVCERFDGRANVEFAAPFAVPKINTVTKTLNVIFEQFGPLGVDVFVHKRLPLAGGMGGSSADCAAVILALDSLFKLTERGFDAARTALKAGSDVPYMLQGGFCRVTGVGENITALGICPTLHLVLCAGNEGVNTGLCYNRFDALHAGQKYSPANNDALVFSLQSGDRPGAICNLKNALTEAACTLAPSVKISLQALKAVGADGIFMTGSGSCCCGVYASKSAAEEAAQKLRERGFFSEAVNTKNSGIELL